MYSPVQAVSHPRVSACEFSRDGETIYTGSRTGTIRAWSVSSRENLTEWVAHDGRVEELAAISPGQIVSAGADGTVTHWDTNAGECLNTFSGHGDVVSSVSARRDGEVVVSGGFDNTVRQWDLSPAEAAGLVKNSPNKVVAVAVNPTDPVIAFGGVGEHVHLWEYESEALLPRLGPHDTAVVDLEFTGDGTTLLTADHSGDVRWWQTDPWSRTEQATISVPGEYSLASAGDRVFVGTDTGVYCFTSTAVVESILDSDVGIQSVAVADSGAHLVAATFDGSIVVYENTAIA